MASGLYSFYKFIMQNVENYHFDDGKYIAEDKWVMYNKRKKKGEEK